MRPFGAPLIKFEIRNSKFEQRRPIRDLKTNPRAPRVKYFEFLISNFEFPLLALLCFLAFLPFARAGDAPQPIDFRGIQIDKQTRTVTFPAAINMTAGMLEYLLVTDMGKTHESLLSTKIQPYDIQVAMLLLGIKPASKADSQPPAQITRQYLQNSPGLKGETINLFLSWQDPTGNHRVRAESIIWNLHTNAPMTDGPWTYNGSEMYGGKFLAQVDGSIGALVRDPAALLNNPRPGNDDDQIWEVNTKTVPKAGTPVDVIIELEESSSK
jgi:hypothetical protein